MTYTQRIEVGQRWISRDRRDNGRTVTVEQVDPAVNTPGNNGFVVVRWARRSTMRATTLHTRYRLAPASSAAGGADGGAGRG